MFAARNPINAWPGSQRFNGVPLVMSGQRHSQFALRFIDILRKQGAPFGLIETAQTASPVVLQDCLSAEQLLLLRGAVPRAVHTLRFPHGFSDGQTELSEAGAAAVAVGGGGEEKGERDGCRLEAAVARTAEGHTKLLTDLLSPPEGGGGAVVTFWMSPENRLCVVGNVLQSSPPNLFQQLWLLPSLVLELLCHQPRAVVAQHIEGWERHARGLSFYVGGFALGLPYREASGVVWSLAEEGKKPLVASRAALFSAFYLLVHRMLAADGVPLAFVDGLFLTAWEALCSSSSSSSAGASGVAAEDTHIASFFAVPSGPGAVAAAAAAPSSLVNSSLYRQQQLRGSIRRCVDLVVRVRALLRGSAAPSSDDICALQLGCLLSAAQASAVPERRPAFISLEHADVIQRAVREKRRAWQANHYEAVNERQAMEKLVSHAMWSSAADLRRFIQQAPTSDLRYVVIRDTTAASLVFSLEKLFPLGSFFVAEMFSEAGRCYQALLVLTADMLWIYQRYSMSRFLSSPSIAPGLRPVLWQPLPFAPTLFQCLSSSVPLHRRIGVMILRDLLGFTRLPRLPTALASSAGIVQSCDKVAAFVLRLARLACEAPRSAGAVEDFMAVAVTVLSMAAAFVAPVDKLEVDMEQLLEAGPIDVGFVAKLREAEKCGLAGFALWEHVIDGLQDAAQSFDSFMRLQSVTQYFVVQLSDSDGRADAARYEVGRLFKQQSLAKPCRALVAAAEECRCGSPEAAALLLLSALVEQSSCASTDDAFSPVKFVPIPKAPAGAACGVWELPIPPTEHVCLRMYDMPVAIFQTATRVEAVYPESFFCVWRVDTDPVTGSVPDIGDSLTFGLWQLANGRIPAPGDLSVLNRALSAYHQRHGAAGYEGRCSVEIPDEHDVLCGSPLASPGDGKDAAKTPDHPPDSPPAMSRKRRREGEGEDDGYHSGSVAGLSEGPVSPRLKRAKACGGSTFAALCRSIADHGVFDLDDTDVPSFATSYTSDASRRPVGL